MVTTHYVAGSTKGVKYACWLNTKYYPNGHGNGRGGGLGGRVGQKTQDFTQTRPEFVSIGLPDVITLHIWAQTMGFFSTPKEVQVVLPKFNWSTMCGNVNVVQARKNLQLKYTRLKIVLSITKKKEN